METLEKKAVKTVIDIKDTINKYSKILVKERDADGRRIFISSSLRYIMHSSIAAQQSVCLFKYEVIDLAPNFKKIIPFSESEIGFIIMYCVVQMWKKDANIQQPSTMLTFISENGTMYIEISTNSNDFNINISCSYEEPNLIEYDRFNFEYNIYSKVS